jgi:hypothetical protein
MKTYFMAWESDNRRGHAIWEFGPNDDGSEITPRQALSAMRQSVIDGAVGSENAIVGELSAIQFNLVT